MEAIFVSARRRLSPIWFSRLLSVFVIMTTLAQAVDVIEGPQIVWDEDEVGATISWRTDQPSGAVVRLGRQADQLAEKHTGPVGTAHRITVPELKKEGRYYYSLGTARRELKAGFFDGSSSIAQPEQSQAEPEKKNGFTLLPKKLFTKDKAEVADDKKASATKPAAPGTKTAPPTSQTWANVATLEDHYVRHGRDFQAKSADDYAAQAWLFLQRARAEGLPAKIDPEGTTRVWEPKTRAFAAYNRQMKTKTYFRPRRPDYFADQPGQPIKLK
jgi:hypothetical protein